MNDDQLYWTTEAMMTYGGSFVQTLGLLMRKADPSNLAKLLGAFPDYIKNYKEIGEELLKSKQP
jgi:hypothetical protein